MTMPSEELRSIKRAHKFLVEKCLWQSKRSILWMILTGKFDAWRKDCYWLCLRHYPSDCHIDRLYKDSVCLACGSDKQFCKCNKGK